MSPKTSKGIAVGLGIACIILVAGLIGAVANYASIITNNNNRISDLQSQLNLTQTGLNDSESLLNLTQTWLNDNESLLNLTQTWLNGNESLLNELRPVVTEGSANPNQASAPSAWERTGNFLAGDVIEVDLLWNIFWAQIGGFDTLEINGTYYSVLYVEVSITDPSNAVSHYELWLSYDESQNQFSWINARVLSLGAGINSSVYLPTGFNFTYTFIAGTANLSGAYFVNVTSVEGTTPDYRVYKNGVYDPSALELFYTRVSYSF